MVDQEGFSTWYRAERPALVTTLSLLAGDREIAQDAVDEALARACERWERVGQMESPTAWTFRTAINLLKRRGRRRSLERLLLRRTSTEPASGESPPWSIDVRNALADLPPRMKQVMVLHYVADLAVRDIAIVLEIAEGTVLSTLHDGRKRLVQSLGRTEEVR